MTYRNTKVRHTSLHNALLDLLDFLADIENTALVAHNGKSYDFIILYRVAAATGLLPRFKSCIHGFLDSLPLCRNQLPGYDRHSLKVLYESLMDKQLDGHDAKNDCVALENVVRKVGASLSTMQNFSFGWETVMDKTLKHWPG